MRRLVRRQALLLVDLIMVAAATILALALRDNFDVSVQRLYALLPYLGTTLVTAAIILSASGIYCSFWRFSAMPDYLRVIAAVIAIVLAAVAIRFVTNRLDGVARAVPIIQALLMMLLLVGVRVGMRLRYARRRHIALPAPGIGNAAGETVLVVGLNPITELFIRSVSEFAPERIKIAGIVGRSERHSGRRLHQYRILGIPEDVESILRTLEVHGISVNRIVVTVAFGALSPVAQQALLDVEKKSDIRLDFFAERIGLDASAERGAAGRSVLDTPKGLTFSACEIQELARRPYLKTKRVIELAVASIVAVLGLPVILLVALLVAVDVGLPMIFWQQRPGMGGRPFKLYKFRTMGRAHDHNGRRIPDDERLSAIGRFLRRIRLDELPQLYNIIAGDMSFVGPRPLLPIDQPAAFAARLLVRPGLTGWAQVAGGREISARDKAVLDIWYVRHASLRVDLQVIARTVPMIIFGEQPDARVLRQAWNELEKSRQIGAVGLKAVVEASARHHAA